MTSALFKESQSKSDRAFTATKVHRNIVKKAQILLLSCNVMLGKHRVRREITVVIVICIGIKR